MDQDHDQVIEYEYRGRIWKLPGHLVRLQTALAEADIDCRREYADPHELAAARARRLELTLEKYRLARSWWDGFEKYERWHANWALQDDARAQAESVPPERTRRSPNQPVSSSPNTIAASTVSADPRTDPGRPAGAARARHERTRRPEPAR